MILKAILLIASAFGLLWTIKMKRIFPAIITVGMVLGIVLTLFLSNSTLYPGIIVYLGFVTLAFVYGLVIKGMELWPRLIIVLMSAGIFAYWLWILNHWHGNEYLAAVFVLITGEAGVLSKVKLKNELGFLVILAADAIAIIIEHIMKAA
jgi:hypothetical protein